MYFVEIQFFNYFLDLISVKNFNVCENATVTKGSLTGRAGNFVNQL